MYKILCLGNNKYAYSKQTTAPKRIDTENRVELIFYSK